ncbi:MAG: hydroxyacid dehydrogenase [Burkholderiaceae bacterium]
MPQVLITMPVDDVGIQLLRAHPGWTLDLVQSPTPEEFACRLEQADAVILRYQPLQRSAIERAPKLKFVARHGVGYDSVDLDALNERRIPLAITVNANASSVAEHAFSLLLAVARRTLAGDQSVRCGRWQMGVTMPLMELAGKTALVVGAGRIGCAMAQRLHAFDVTVSIYDPELPLDAPLPEGLERVVDLNAALARSDIVSLHLPLTHKTHHLINPLVCKKGAILINTARGPVVSEALLIEALSSGHLGGAGLDVFEQEPLMASSALAELPQVVLSPHIAALTDAALRRMSSECAHNIIDFFGGQVNRGAVINPQVLSS